MAAFDAATAAAAVVVAALECNATSPLPPSLLPPPLVVVARGRIHTHAHTYVRVCKGGGGEKKKHLHFASECKLRSIVSLYRKDHVYVRKDEKGVRGVWAVKEEEEEDSKAKHSKREGGGSFCSDKTSILSSEREGESNCAFLPWQKKNGRVTLAHSTVVYSGQQACFSYIIHNPPTTWERDKSNISPGEMDGDEGRKMKKSGAMVLSASPGDGKMREAKCIGSE